MDIVRSGEWFLRKLSKCSNDAQELLKSQEDLLKIILRSASSPKQVRERTSGLIIFTVNTAITISLSDFPHQPYPLCLEPVIMNMVEIGRHCSSCPIDLGVLRPSSVMWCSEMTSLRLLPFFPLAVSIITGKLKHSQSGRLPHGLVSRPPLTLISIYSCVRGMEGPLSLIFLLYSLLYLHIFLVDKNPSAEDNVLQFGIELLNGHHFLAPWSPQKTSPWKQWHWPYQLMGYWRNNITFICS